MVVLSGKPIGDGNPVFITFEAGPTHNGFESAKRLIDIAAGAHADAIKFQVLDAARLVRDPQMKVKYGYLKDRDTGAIANFEEPLRGVLERRGLRRDDWRALKSYADEKGICFFATVAFEEDLALMTDLDCQSIKIASLDVNCLPLLRACAKSGLCVQLDTGNATLGEIEAAVDVMHDEGCDNYIIHQCPSGYPARIESINLRVIPTLKQMFQCPVAFSDHTPGWDMDIAAVALGANLIEKTITEDRTQRSPEHVMSLEPNEAKAFVDAIRDIEVALGRSRRSMTRDEKDRRALRRRSAFVLQDTKAGTPLDQVALEYARPGNGLAPDQIEMLEGAVMAEDIQSGTLLTMQHLQFVVS